MRWRRAGCNVMAEVGALCWQQSGVSPVELSLFPEKGKNVIRGTFQTSRFIFSFKFKLCTNKGHLRSWICVIMILTHHRQLLLRSIMLNWPFLFLQAFKHVSVPCSSNLEESPEVVKQAENRSKTNVFTYMFSLCHVTVSGALCVCVNTARFVFCEMFSSTAAHEKLLLFLPNLCLSRYVSRKCFILSSSAKTSGIASSQQHRTNLLIAFSVDVSFRFFGPSL